MSQKAADKIFVQRDVCKMLMKWTALQAVLLRLTSHLKRARLNSKSEDSCSLAWKQICAKLLRFIFVNILRYVGALVLQLLFYTYNGQVANSMLFSFSKKIMVFNFMFFYNSS